MGYIKSLAAELRKVTWINRKSLFSTVFAVMLISVFLTSYIYGIDSLSDIVSKLIINKI